jgi:methylated-DNA-protein-cysteine methyltransferase-like protein
MGAARRHERPWHRVERAGSRESAHTRAPTALQRALLEREGIRFDASGRIELARFGWQPRDRARRESMSRR